MAELPADDDPAVELCHVTWFVVPVGHPHHCDDLAGHPGRHVCAEPGCRSWQPPSLTLRSTP